MKTINIIGAGLIGQERIKAVSKLQARGLPVTIGSVYDPYQPRLKDLATEYNFRITEKIDDFYSESADLVIVACPHDVATEHTCRVLEVGHIVLIEKPLGRNYLETERIAKCAEQKGGKLFIGLNYRFMPGIAALVTDWHSNRFGDPISLSMKIGHGGKPGDEKTWKLDPVACGGGALLDPGIHMLDLCTLLVGSHPKIKTVSSWSGFWNTGIEEEVHLIFKKDTVTISIEISLVRWRSCFELSAHGTDGYGIVTGRGRSYGPQQYCRGKRWGWQHAENQAASEELILESSCEDSFVEELAACLDLQKSKLPPATLSDGLALMKLYQDVKEQLEP